MTRLLRLAATLVCALVVLTGLRASADERYQELAEFPGQGIPDIRGALRISGGWETPQQAGVSYLARARQWTRTPVLQAVALNRQTQQFNDPTCRRIPQAPGANQFREWWADAVLVDRSTAVDSPRRYGSTQPFVVRTAGFGTLPVEATVALEQPRNSHRVVVPAELKQPMVRYCAGQGDFDIPPPANGFYTGPADLRGSLRVRVDQVVVDGVRLALAGCGADGAELRLTSRDLMGWDPRVPEADRPGGGAARSNTQYFSITVGGLLFGTLDIPAFTGCLTNGGEDLSALLTATVSGPGNTVRIRTEGTETERAPDGPSGEFNKCPFTSNCGDRLPPPELPTAPPS